MSDDTINKSALVNLPEMPKSVDNALQNLTDSPTKNIGQTFSDIWYLVFGSISHVANKKRIKYAADLEQYQTQLNQAINLIPEEKRIDPDIQTTAQALENSKYCISSDILRKMFVNLISGSMNSDMQSFVHPSFPEILKQLSNDDALLLKNIFQAKQSHFPVAKIGVRTDGNGYNVFYDNVFILDSLDFSPAKCSLSLSSLQRACLISIDYSRWMSSDREYDILKQTPEYLNMVEFSASLGQSSPYFGKGLIQLTPLGRSFCSICIEKN